MSHNESDPTNMDVVSANAFLMHAGLKCNKVEFENLFDLYPGASPGCCEMDAFISEMQIDPPVTYEFGAAADEKTQLGEATPVQSEEDVIIDSRKLYKNFMSLVENQQWKPIS